MIYTSVHKTTKRSDNNENPNSELKLYTSGFFKLTFNKQKAKLKVGTNKTVLSSQNFQMFFFNRLRLPYP